jgi:hypothetical protein
MPCGHGLGGEVTIGDSVVSSRLGGLGITSPAFQDNTALQAHCMQVAYMPSYLYLKTSTVALSKPQSPTLAPSHYPLASA